jgi:hypothetical protein
MDLSSVHGYAQFAFLPGDAGATLLNSADDRLLIQPSLLQLVMEVESTAERAQLDAWAILECTVERLALKAFLQCGIKVVAHTEAPGPSPDARSFIASHLSSTDERASGLGEGFYSGGMKFRRIRNDTIASDETLQVEPLVADNHFVFIEYDIQRAGQLGIDLIPEWLESAFDFVRTRVRRVLEA